MNIFAFPQEIILAIIKMIDLSPTSSRLDVRSIGYLAATCRYFRDLIQINSPKSKILTDPRERTRRIECMLLRRNDLFAQFTKDPNVIDEIRKCILEHVTPEAYDKYGDKIVTKPRHLELLTRSQYITIETLLKILSHNEKFSPTGTYFQLCEKSFITIDELHRNGLLVYYRESIEVLTLQECLKYCCNLWTFMESGKITAKEVESRTDIHWSYNHLTCNPNISPKELLKWRKQGTMSDIKITMEEIYRLTEDPECREAYENMIVGMKAPYEDLLECISKKFSFQTIVNNQDYPWNWRVVGRRYGADHHAECESKGLTLPWNENDFQFVSTHEDLAVRKHYHKMFLDGTLTMEIILADRKESSEWNWNTNLLAKSPHFSAREICDELLIEVDDLDPKFSQRDDITVDVFMNNVYDLNVMLVVPTLFKKALE
jgi:hypothetical protein